MLAHELSSAHWACSVFVFLYIALEPGNNAVLVEGVGAFAHSGWAGDAGVGAFRTSRLELASTDAADVILGVNIGPFPHCHWDPLFNYHLHELGYVSVNIALLLRTRTNTMKNICTHTTVIHTLTTSMKNIRIQDIYVYNYYTHKL